MIEASPFVALFRTPQAHYVYDVNTNEIVRVNQCVHDVLGDWGKVPGPEIIDKYGAIYGRQAVLEAIQEINIARQENDLFSSHRLEKLQLPVSSEEIDSSFNRGLEHLILNITEQCNLRCRYCLYSGHYKYQRRHSRRQMKLSTAIKALELFLPHSVDTELPFLGLFGGEPLLRPHFIRTVLDYIREHYPDRRLNVNLTTNGILLRDEFLKYLVDNEVSLRVSLDGPRHIHDSMRCFPDGSGTYDIILRNLKEAKRLYPSYFEQKIALGITIHSSQDIKEVYDFFLNGENLFCDNSISIDYVDSRDTSLYDKGVLPLESTANKDFLENRFLEILLAGQLPDKFLRDLLDFPMMKIHQRQMTRLGKTHHPNGLCLPGVRRLFCTIDGDLSVCERVNPGLNIGHVDAGIDRERALEITEQYAELSYPDCRDCWAVRLCSMCFSHLYGDRFDIERKRLLCSGTRSTLLEALSRYCTVLEAQENAFDYLDRAEMK